MAETLTKIVEEAGVPPVPVGGLPAGDTSATAPTAAPVAPPPASDWSPLKNPVFRALWLASAVSYTGFEIRNYAAPLLMAEPQFKAKFGISAGMAAYTMTASTLPIPLLVLLAGALADVLDRRKLLIFTHLWMMVAAALLGILTMTHLVTPWMMLGFLFVIGAGFAMANPALLAVLPELVEPRELRSAMALNSVNMNIARVAGPGIGALIVVIFGDHYYLGKGAAFLATALSLTGVVWVLANWKPGERKRPAHPETVWGAIRTGFRYTWFSPRLMVVLGRVFIFILCASILPTFAGLICKRNPAILHGDLGAGLLLVCFGIGAIIGVYLMQPMQRRFGVEETVFVGTILFGVATIFVAKMPALWVGCAGMFVAGFNWVIIPTNFNVATQLAVPLWVKGRAMGMYVLVLWGSFAGGSAIFGRVMTQEGPRTALLAAGIGVIIGAVAIFWLRLVPRTSEDYTPVKRELASTPPAEDGPVQVAIHYHVDPQRRRAFEDVMRHLRGHRLRNGATDWRLSPAGPGEFTESFAFSSWRDRVRHHDRTTRADLELEEQALAMHTAPEPPAVKYSPYVQPPGPFSRERMGAALDYGLDRFASEFDRMFDRMLIARTRDLLHRRPGSDETTEEATFLIELPVIRERK